MGAKKGNTIIISLILIFIFSSLIGCIFVFSGALSRQVDVTTKDIIINRELELKAYEFYINNETNSDLFYIDNDVIYYKEDLTIMFDVFIDNNFINIRRRSIK